MQVFKFEELFEAYFDRYSYDDSPALFMSVVYFGDAEDTIEPESLDGMTWETVKKNINKAFDDYKNRKYKN